MKSFPCRVHCVGDAVLLVYLQLKNVGLIWIVDVQEASVFSSLPRSESSSRVSGMVLLGAERASHISTCQFQGVRAGMDECVVCTLAHMNRDPSMKQKPSLFRNVSCGEDEMDALESQSVAGSPTVWC